jgi:hypothetical protein
LPKWIEAGEPGGVNCATIPVFRLYW